jgi:ectoine hydroxylase-related dioxygenase (phytanoyl-CoA dioxygenase family)
MNPVFKDHQLQKKFTRDGYVVIKGLLQKEELDGLIEIFEKHTAEYNSSFHTTHFSKNSNYKNEAHQSISKITFRRIEPYLLNYKPLFGNFMVKMPDPNTALDIHSDWTYVDEEKETSIAIWSPLVDTFPENGCLGIVRGSHKITNKIRGPLILESSRNFNSEWATNFGELLPMKAGDGIFYHHGLLHFSPPNKTNKIRPALNLSVVPEKARCLHFCMPEGSQEIEVYEVNNSEFYLQYDNFQRPKTDSLLKKLPADTVKYIDTEMKNFKLKRWFKNLLS